MKPIYSRLALPLVLLLLPGLVACEEGKSRQDLILEYLDNMGVIESIDLSTEMMRVEYEEYYPFLPNAFWDSPRVVALWDNYKVALLRGYTEALEDGLSDEELDFLVEFYRTEDGKRAVTLWRSLDPLMVAAGSEAGRAFTDELTFLMEEWAE